MSEEWALPGWQQENDCWVSSHKYTGEKVDRRQVVYPERAEVFMFQGSSEMKEKCIIASN